MNKISVVTCANKYICNE